MRAGPPLRQLEHVSIVVVSVRDVLSGGVEDRDAVRRWTVLSGGVGVAEDVPIGELLLLRMQPDRVPVRPLLSRGRFGSGAVPSGLLLQGGAVERLGNGNLSGEVPVSNGRHVP